MCPTWQGLLFTPGKSNPYCEVTMGSQCHITKTIQDTLNPKWNSNCQFFIRDLEQDVLCITVFERDQFSPDGEWEMALPAPLASLRPPPSGCSPLHALPSGDLGYHPLCPRGILGPTPPSCRVHASPSENPNRAVPGLLS